MDRIRPVTTLSIPSPMVSTLSTAVPVMTIRAT